MHEFNQITFGDLIKSVASDEPTTGGGCASALSASIGVGLIRMAIEITKKSPEAEREELEKYQHQLATLNDDLVILAAQDSYVFEKYMQALSLPKGSDAEISARNNMLYMASLKATESPLDIASSILKGIDIATKVRSLIKKSIISDLYAGVELLFGSLNAILLNVDINLTSKRMEEKKDFYLSQKNDIKKRAQFFINSIRSASHLDGFSHE